MDPKTLTLHCIYSDDGSPLDDLLQESFRLFLLEALCLRS